MISLRMHGAFGHIGDGASSRGLLGDGGSGVCGYEEYGEAQEDEVSGEGEFGRRR